MGANQHCRPPRHLPLVDILVDAQAELQELVVASGLKVLAAMLEEDRVAVCGPRYAHQPARRASRAGHAPSKVVLGGGKVALRRPRVRIDGQEVALPSVQAFTNTDPPPAHVARLFACAGVMLVAFHLRRLRDRESDTGYDTPRGSSDGALAGVSQTAVYDTC